MGIEIPFTANEGYIAFVYEATNNWFTVGVDSITIIPDILPTSNESIFLEKEIKIYPNPASDFVMLTISKDVSLDDYEVSVFNHLGQFIFAQPIQNYETVLDFSELSGGVFYYEVKGNGGVLKVGKVLLE